MSDITSRPEEPPAQGIDWLRCRYVAIDVEGTASPAGQREGLVEVAAVEFFLDPPVGRTVHGVLDPGMPITATITPNPQVARLRCRRPTIASAGPTRAEARRAELAAAARAPAADEECLWRGLADSGASLISATATTRSAS